MNGEVTLVVTTQELDYVMTCLAQQPFGQVNGFIQKLVNQANAQNGTVVSTPPEQEGTVTDVPVTEPSAMQQMVEMEVSRQLGVKENRNAN